VSFREATEAETVEDSFVAAGAWVRDAAGGADPDAR
jgi:hypothetical protein